jgi:hypothetical protein
LSKGKVRWNRNAGAVSFKECELDGHRCTTSGQPKGAVLTNVLEATFVEEGPLVLVLLKPSTGTAWFTNTKCGFEEFELEGSLLGTLTPQSTKTKTLTATFKQTSGMQEQHELEGNEDVLMSDWDGSIEQAGLASTETLTLEGGEGALEP